MKGSSLRYLLGEGAKNVWYNRLMSLASVGVLTTCLLMVGFAMLFTMNVNRIVGYVEQQNEVAVFVEDDATQEEITALREQLESNSNLFDIRYVSKEDAMEELREQLGQDADLLDGMDNICPASFNIRLRDMSKMEQTVRELESIENVLQVNAATEVGKTLTSARSLINMVAVVVVGALIIVSVVIIANTIRATVFARRREINIMKYVGATNGFIRLPFVVEGFLLGLISALIAFLVIWGAYLGIVHLLTGDSSPLLRSAFQNLIPFGEVALPLGLSFAGAGMLTGGVGSAFSIGSHLKV